MQLVDGFEKTRVLPMLKADAGFEDARILQDFSTVPTYSGFGHGRSKLKEMTGGHTHEKVEDFHPI